MVTPLQNLLPQSINMQSPSIKLVAFWILIFACHLIAGLIGFTLYGDLINIYPAVIWAPAGIAIAAVALCGYTALIPIGLSALTLAIVRGGEPTIFLPLVAAIVFQAFVAGYLFRKLNFNPQLSTMRDMFLLMIVALGTTAITPLVRTIIVLSSNYLNGTTLSLQWGFWWTGAALSAIVLAPLILMAFSRPKVVALSRREFVEFGLLCTVFAAFSLYIFSATIPESYRVLVFIGHLMTLGWIALRHGVFLTSASLFTMVLISLAGAIWGNYTMPEGGISARIFSVQVYNLLLIIFFFMLASVEEQRKNAAAKIVEYTQRVEDALKKSNLEEIGKNEFIAMLAHELRNPLALFENSLGLLLFETKRNPEAAHLVNSMRNRIWSMARLLDDLLDISRVTQQKFGIISEVFDMRAAAKHVTHEIKNLMANRKHTLQVSLPERETFMHGDPARMEQIMFNLLINAAKYTPEGGVIRFSLTSEHGMLVIRISDNGIGIPVNMLPIIFEPYVQAHRSYRLPGVTPSLGVGLSITKKLVELHGGTIEAQSAGEYKGSTFVVRLPSFSQGDQLSAVPQPPPLHAPTLFSEIPSGSPFSVTPYVPTTETAGTNKKPHNVLVVEDEREIADGLKKLLEKVGGHTVATAYNGKDGIKTALSFNPSVAIVDIALPDMDGYEVARSLKSGKTPPFLVAMSGYGQQEHKERARAAGFDEYLVKPAGIEAIQQLLERIRQ